MWEGLSHMDWSVTVGAVGVIFHRRGLPDIMELSERAGDSEAPNEDTDESKACTPMTAITMAAAC